MLEKIRILSTKRLLPGQRQFLLNAGFALVEADFIKIENNNFKIEGNPSSLIFTSQNAVRSFLESQDSKNLKDKKIYCVGSKTKAMLEQNGFKVAVSKEYASELASAIANDHYDETFLFFSGNLRKDVLPEALKKAGVSFEEVEAYKTVLAPQKINSALNGILFFSPSGVESYLKENKIKEEQCFCIGATTAEALRQITENRIIAKHQTVENVIIQAIKYYR
ncbi:MAG TPA: uroporphyrinogen-III synthase [Flavobacterium sp.]|nr:uroporphyrinogen-III synthase [Flavobacterium sp.]